MSDIDEGDHFPMEEVCRRKTGVVGWYSTSTPVLCLKERLLLHGSSLNLNKLVLFLYKCR